MSDSYPSSPQQEIKKDSKSKRPGVSSEVNQGNPFAVKDYNTIIQSFEKQATHWEEEDYTLVSHYRDVYSTRSFSERVKRQLNQYPGVHQIQNSESENPFLTEAQYKSEQRMNYWNSVMTNPSAFKSVQSRQGDFDYTKIFGKEASAKERATNVGKMISECVPCFNRLLDGAQLLPDGDLLEVHALNTNVRVDLLKEIKSLFDSPGFYVDTCELLRLLSHMCPQDLLAISMILTQFLAKLNLDIEFNIDFIVSLVGSVLSPFLDEISSWLDKWIQLILEPGICVLDHINETILIAQDAQIPLSGTEVSVDFQVNSASSSHSNAVYSGEANLEPFAVWGKGEVDRFNTPDTEKYHPDRPSPPIEEWDYGIAEIKENISPSMSVAEKEQHQQKLQQLKEEKEKKLKKSEKRNRLNRDGTRWSKDNVPNSEKSGDFNAGYHPPEKQESPPKKPDEYFDPSPVVSSIVELRNIMQGAIQYIRDWFTYITQMVYDLLGTDIGWMSNKTSTTKIKGKVIQLIKMIKAIINAVDKNGLECGLDSNFGPSQLGFVVAQLNDFTDFDFTMSPDGDIKLDSDTAEIKDYSQDSETISKNNKADIGEEYNDIDVNPGTKITNTEKSGIIIKSCFNNVTEEELAEFRNWLSSDLGIEELK